MNPVPVSFLAAQERPAGEPAASPPLAIETTGLVKAFGRTEALSGLDLHVPRGSTYALLGRNGAGKSTLIQILIGMLEPTSGTAQVLGLDPQKDGVALKQQLGYIPDFLPAYNWMTVAELLRFTRSFYARWSPDEEARLVARFDLPLEQKVGALSRGNRALLALVIAIAHQPEVALLDECTSGMDAIARREFERSVIDTIQSSGRTILFAGHQIDEMERICDWVGVMKGGRLLLEMPLEALKGSVRATRVLTESLDGRPVPQALESRRLGRDTLLTVRLASAEQPLAAALPPEARVLEEIPLSLEEIFVALLGPENQEEGAP